MPRILPALTGLGLLAVAAAAPAMPILSIDVDTATPGVQSTRDVATGTPFDVDLVLTGLPAALSGYSVTVGFGTNLTPTALTNGALVIPLALLPPDLATPGEASGGVGFGSGMGLAGVLASVSLTADSPGLAIFSVDSLSLSSLVVGPITGVQVEGAAVNVLAPLPAPATLMLLAVGLLAARRRGR